MPLLEPDPLLFPSLSSSSLLFSLFLMYSDFARHGRTWGAWLLLRRDPDDAFLSPFFLSSEISGHLHPHPQTTTVDIIYIYESHVKTSLVTFYSSSNFYFSWQPWLSSPSIPLCRCQSLPTSRMSSLITLSHQRLGYPSMMQEILTLIWWILE